MGTHMEERCSHYPSFRFMDLWKQAPEQLARSVKAEICTGGCNRIAVVTKRLRGANMTHLCTNGFTSYPSSRFSAKRVLLD